MNEQNTTKLLSEFYEAKRLPPECVANIQQLVTPANHLDDTSVPQSRSMLRLAPILSAAAAFLLTITSVLFYERDHRPLSTLFKPAVQGSVEANHHELLPAADIIVLKFHADWCRPSLVISPMYVELKRKFEVQDVLFINLNLTDDESLAQSKYLVSALGIEDVWNKHGGITGELLYVDASTREIITSFNAENEYEQMNLALADALAERDGNS